MDCLLLNHLSCHWGQCCDQNCIILGGSRHLCVAGSYRYYFTVVPTTFISAISTRTRSFAYSVTEFFMPGSANGSGGGDINVERMPAVELRIRMSPLATKIWYPQRQLGHFGTRICAVLGGCVAFTQFLHTIVHAVMKARQNPRALVRSLLP